MANECIAQIVNVSYTRNTKQYELTNHLGNVLATISHSKKAGSNDVTILTTSDYYAFGMEIKERSYGLDGVFRYGYNGKENDRDWGTGLIQDYGFRLYNPEVARFLSVDPLSPEYPWYTPYQFAGNKPINCIDLDGLEDDDAYIPNTKDNIKTIITNAEEVQKKINSKKSIYQLKKEKLDNLKLSATYRPYTGTFGNYDYYIWRYNNFIKRYKTSIDEGIVKVPDYYLEYGNKYLQKFTKETNDKLSKEGKEWLIGARANLQSKMEREIRLDPTIELDNKRFTEMAFDTHPDAYWEAGLMNLPPSDLVEIVKTPDISDLVSTDGISQVLNIIGKFLAEGAKQIKEGHGLQDYQEQVKNGTITIR